MSTDNRKEPRMRIYRAPKEAVEEFNRQYIKDLDECFQERLKTDDALGINKYRNPPEFYKVFFR